MTDDINKLLQNAEEMRKIQEQRITILLKDIDKLPEDKRKFFQDSLSLAQRGELSLDGFLLQAKKLMQDAS